MKLRIMEKSSEYLYKWSTWIQCWLFFCIEFSAFGVKCSTSTETNVKHSMKFHNAFAIKLSEIVHFYEPINRTNKTVHNNLLHLGQLAWKVRHLCTQCLNETSFNRIEKLLLWLLIFLWLCDMAMVTHTPVCRYVLRWFLWFFSSLYFWVY